MKIQIWQYRKLQYACLEVLKANPAMTLGYYQSIGLSAKRFNWDVLNAGTIDGAPSNRYVCDVLYKEGLDDSHINSALRLILGNDGKDSKGRK